RIQMPALLTIQSGISKLRYATLMGIKKAKTKEVRRLAAADLPASGQPSVQLERVYLPHRKKETQILTGTPAEAAAKMADILKFEVRVI
ncbi:MAG TPA: electron transfer flavoprotein subunit beta, partial [Bryobacteraceae bacterium]